LLLDVGGGRVQDGGSGRSWSGGFRDGGLGSIGKVGSGSIVEEIGRFLKDEERKGGLGENGEEKEKTRARKIQAHLSELGHVDQSSEVLEVRALVVELSEIEMLSVVSSS